ncbi:MAG: DNA translocase FtsK [Anaerolineales bacterium]|nr:DNA translocase FtsK [Anaerolineales bacterium]
MKSKQRGAKRRGPKRAARRELAATTPRSAEFQQYLLGTLLATARGLRRYAADVAGILLLATGCISMMALLGVSQGTWTMAVSDALVVWLGWGSAFAPLSLLVIGGVLLARGMGWRQRVPWVRVISAELAVLCVLGGAHLRIAAAAAASLGMEMAGVLQGGGMVAEALDGRGGGKIGWAVAVLAGELANESAGWLLALFGGAALAVGLGLRWQQLLFGLIALQGILGNTQREARPRPARGRSRTAPKDNSRRVVRPRGKEQGYTVAADHHQRKPESRRRSKLLPPLHLLGEGEALRPSESEINRNAQIIEHTLQEFGVPAEVIDFRVGPAVTQFAVQPGFVEKASKDGSIRRNKVRVAQISNRASDLTLALSARSIRVEAPVPGQSFVGIEVPNRQKTNVGLRSVIDSQAFHSLNSPLAIAMGLDVSGAPVAADLGAMPHLLIAGTTGSGKSVCITSIVTCLIYNNSPSDLRLVMVDPKKVELLRYNGLPHLLGRVEVELDRIIGTLRWMTREMDRRYRKMEKLGARDLDDYNNKIKRRRGEEKMPRIVVVVDELADLMMMAQNETEQTLVRLAQMARATGIHLVVATQRPSTDIVTGLIKANFPARISFAVASSTDSRVILDSTGAESLLGKGDMLFLSADAPSPMRIQGVYTSDAEVDEIVEHWLERIGDDSVDVDTAAEQETRLQVQAKAAPWDDLLRERAQVADKDDQIMQAVEVVKRHRTASASLLQRKLKIGHPRAARIMDELFEMGVVGEPRQGGKTREVLLDPSETLEVEHD